MREAKEIRSSGETKGTHKKREAKEVYSPHRDLCPFGYGEGCGGGASINPATKAQVANILRGILSNISGKKGLVQISADLIQQGLHKTENAEARKALVSLLSAFRVHAKEATAVVLELTGEPHGTHVTALAGMSKQLSKMAPIKEQTQKRKYVRTMAQEQRWWAPLAVATQDSLAATLLRDAPHLLHG